MFDFFPKFIDASMVHKTTCGAIISIISIAAVAALSFFEIYSFVYPPIKSELVSLSELSDALSDFTISFNFSVDLPCILVSIDIYDVLGTLTDPNSKSIYKLRLDNNRNPIPYSQVSQNCGSCYGTEFAEGSRCCNTCEDVVSHHIKAGRPLTNVTTWQQCINEKYDFTGKEKCQIFGNHHVSAIDGGIRILPRFSSNEEPFTKLLNLTHYIDHITFGTSFGPQPLDDALIVQSEPGQFHYRYDLKAVPTVMHNQDGSITHGFQYAVDSAKIPITDRTRLGEGIFFNYYFATVAVVGKPDRFTIYILISRLFCIFGGGFFLARLIDSFGYRIHTMEGKMRIGKAA